MTETREIGADEVHFVDESVTAALVKAEIDQQIATARAFARDPSAFRTRCLKLIRSSEAVAEDCIYAIPRDGKMIEGPTARLAEIVAANWGNCRAGARVLDDRGDFVTAQGVFMDLETNVAITYEVRRRIVDKRGRRYSPDMVAVTANAACSIALRNAVFKGIPKAIWSELYDEARTKVAGDHETLANRRAKAMAHLQKLGATEARILAALRTEEGEAGVPLTAVDQITPQHLATLKGIAVAIRDGETTVDEAFPDPTKKDAPAPDTSKGMAGLRKIAEKEAGGETNPSPEATAPVGG